MRAAVPLVAASALLVGAVLRPPDAAGQERAYVRGIGMGGAAVACSRGIDAVGINPANLGITEPGTVTLSLGVIGFHIGSDFFDYRLYREYFTGFETDSGRIGRHLSDADKQTILGAFEGDVGHLVGDFSSRPLGVSYRVGEIGAVALTVNEGLDASFDLPKEYVEFLFYGNTPGSAYDFSGARGSMAWTRSYTLTVGVALPWVSVVPSLHAGVAVKVVHGFAYSELQRFNTTLVTSPYGVLDATVNMNARMAQADFLDNTTGVGYGLFPAPAGAGMGYDIGLSSEVMEGFFCGLSVTDIGTMEWSRNITEVVADGALHLDDPLSESQRDSVMDLVHGETMEGKPFSSPLPTTLRVGVAAELHRLFEHVAFIPGRLLVAADVRKGLVDAPGTSLSPRFSFGIEYRPVAFLPLRTGVGFGGDQATSFALGLGLHLGLFELDLASEALQWVLDPDEFSSGSASLGMKFRF